MEFNDTVHYHRNTEFGVSVSRKHRIQRHPIVETQNLVLAYLGNTEFDDTVYYGALEVPPDLFGKMFSG